MTDEEATKLAFVFGHADSGCSTCVEILCDLANETFPEFRWTVESGISRDSEGFDYVNVSVQKT